MGFYYLSMRLSFNFKENAMKYLGILLTASILMGFVLLQDRDIPARDVPKEVMDTFNSAFSDARDIDWEKKGKEYEADFEIQNVDYSARFSADGDLIMQKQDITTSDIPEPVNAAIQKEYEGYYIDDVERIDKDGKVYFQVELDGKMRDRKVVFSADGDKANKLKYWD